MGWGAYIKQGAPRSCTSLTRTQSSSAQPGPGPAARVGADPQHREYGRSLPGRNRTQASCRSGAGHSVLGTLGTHRAGEAPRVETRTSSCRLEQAEIDHRCPPGLGPGPPSVFSYQVLDVRACAPTRAGVQFLVWSVPSSHWIPEGVHGPPKGKERRRCQAPF